MPRITNHAGLPDPIVRAVTYSDRNVGDSDWTITELITPPRIVALRRHHAEEITEDAADRIWALMGSAAHEVLRRAASVPSNRVMCRLCGHEWGKHDDQYGCSGDPDEGCECEEYVPDHGYSSDGSNPIVESRVFATVDGKRISGQIDYSIKDGAIYDYKMVSVWAVKDGPKPEWVQQLNCYHWLLSRCYESWPEQPKNGVLEIIALLRDWSKMEASRDPQYPQQGVLVLPVPVWPLDQTEAWIKERIAMHEAAKQVLPECTPEDVWEKPEKWAVKKKGKVRASRLLDTREEADIYAVTNFKAGQSEIERRPAERPRCEHYCACAKFCVQFQTWKAVNQPDAATV